MNKFQALYEERAGIIEYDAGLPREEAEQRALESVLVDFIKENYPTAFKKYQEIITKKGVVS